MAGFTGGGWKTTHFHDRSEYNFFMQILKTEKMFALLVSERFVLLFKGQHNEIHSIEE